jgi:predicted CoA-binding protein
VNPNVTEVLGEKAYATLGEIPEKIDLVDIFRRPEFVRPVVESAIRIGAKAIWMQETVEDVPAGRLAREAGLAVMMDSCIMREHARCLRDRKS